MSRYSFIRNVRMIGAHFSGSIIGLQLPSISMKSFVNRIIFLQHLNKNSHFHAPVSSRCFGKFPDASGDCCYIHFASFGNKNQEGKTRHKNIPR